MVYMIGMFHRRINVALIIAAFYGERKGKFLKRVLQPHAFPLMQIYWLERCRSTFDGIFYVMNFISFD